MPQDHVPQENKQLDPPRIQHRPKRQQKDPSNLAEHVEESPPIVAALTAARTAGRSIHSLLLLGEDSASYITRRRVVSAFRREIIPPGRPGRKRSAEITAALADWKAGLRGLQLYQRHIPSWDKMSHWRRRIEAERLRDAISTRRRRQRLA